MSWGPWGHKKMAFAHGGYALRSSFPKGDKHGDFSLIKEESLKSSLEDAWKSFSRPLLQRMIKSNEYTCGQLLHKFMEGLEDHSLHSGGSAVTYFQVCKLAEEDWKELLKWCESDDCMYLPFNQETRSNARTALSKLMG